MGCVWGDVLVPKGLFIGPRPSMAAAAGSHKTEMNSIGNGGMQRNVVVLNESL